MKNCALATFIALTSVACSPTPCPQWKDWEFPKLDKIVSCYQGGITLRLAGDPETLWAMFEKRGYERGWSDALLINNDRSLYFRKAGVDELYGVHERNGEFTISTQSQKELSFLPQAELPLLDSFPADLAAWHTKLADVPARFDDTRTRAPVCDAAMVKEALEPPTPAMEGAFVLNVDQLASGTETRKGVPALLKAHDRTAPNWLREARRQFDVVRRRKTVMAFHVTKYVEPAFVGDSKQLEDGTILEHYTAGVVGLDLALIDLSTHAVLCRKTAAARSSSSVQMNSNLELDLARNVGLAVQAAFKTP